MEELTKRKKRAATRTGTDKSAAQELCAGRVMRGSLVTMRRTCGKKSCRCARGALHESLYVSQSSGGKTRLAYVPEECAAAVREWTRRYQRVRALMERMSEQAWRALARRDV